MKTASNAFLQVPGNHGPTVDLSVVSDLNGCKKAWNRLNMLPTLAFGRGVRRCFASIVSCLLSNLLDSTDLWKLDLMCLF